MNPDMNLYRKSLDVSVLSTIIKIIKNKIQHTIYFN